MYLFCAMSSQHNCFETPSCCSVYIHSSFLLIAEQGPFFFKTTTVSLPLLKVHLKSSSLSCNPQFLNFPIVPKCAFIVGLFVLGRKSVRSHSGTLFPLLLASTPGYQLIIFNNDFTVMASTYAEMPRNPPQLLILNVQFLVSCRVRVSILRMARIVQMVES